jgi:D-alanyl-D-alanine carboxypeptidase (penicillin-binding protein 5/6)
MAQQRMSRQRKQKKPPELSPQRKQPLWVVVARAIILVFICIAMVASLMLGTCATANADQRPTDAIDGVPVTNFAGVTNDIPDIVAEYAALAASDGHILFQRGADRAIPMASTTKIMTAVVALENCELDRQLKVTRGAANAGGSEAGLEEGMELCFEDALYAMMVPSGNDAAVVIAENIATSEGRFVQMMNDKAAELGMSNTLFNDASGLSAEGHYTTANDYLKLTTYAMKIPLFREVAATQYKEITIGDVQLELYTTDKLFDVLEVGQPLGIKTGFIDEAGYCFVGAAVKGNIELYAVIFNAPDDMQRFYDAATLLEWGFAHFRQIELLNSAQLVGSVALTSWLDKTVDVYVAKPVFVNLLDLSGVISQEVTINDVEGDVLRGQVVGKIVWLQKGEVIASSELVAADGVAAPDFWHGVQIWWLRFFSGFFGDATSASSSVVLPTSVPVPEAPPEAPTQADD